MEISFGSRVSHGGRVGKVCNFRSFTEDGIRYTFATVAFPDGSCEGIDVDEFDPAPEKITREEANFLLRLGGVPGGLDSVDLA